jgi:hypothetical protein
VGSSAARFARYLSGQIDELAAALAPGVIDSDWAPGTGSCPDAYVFIHIRGRAVGSTCPVDFCIDADLAGECCLPLTGSCPGGPSLQTLSLSGIDCNSNGLDDMIDFLSATLTDENANTVFDQCEGFCIPSPLGFPITPIGSALVSCGPDRTIALGPDAGVSVNTHGFDSFGVALSANLAGAPLLTSDLVFQSRGVIGGTPNLLRGSVRLELTGNGPPTFTAFATYAPLGAPAMVVRLVDLGGETLATAQFPASILTPLVEMGVLPAEVEMDARLAEGSPSPRRMARLRFAEPVDATLLSAEPVPVKGVSEIQLIAHASDEETLGVLNSVSVVSGDFASVTMTQMFAGFDELDRWTPIGNADLSAAAQNPPGTSVCVRDATTGARAEAGAMAGVSDKKVAQEMSVTIENLPPAAQLPECGVLRWVFCGIPEVPGMAPEVDPVEFALRSPSLGAPVVADIDVPICLSQLCTATAGGRLVVEVFVDPSGPIPSGICSGPSHSRYSCYRPTSGMVNLGHTSRLPNLVKESLDTNGIPCFVTMYSGATSIDFTTSNGPVCSSGGVFRCAASNLVVRMSVEMITDPAYGFTAITAVKVESKGLNPIKFVDGSAALSVQSCGDHNGDGQVNSGDFFDFLAAFFAGPVDTNIDGVTNSQDFFDFLVCFFSIS